MYSGYRGHVYSGQSDIVARKCWPKVATISEVHCMLDARNVLMRSWFEIWKPGHPNTAVITLFISAHISGVQN